MASIRCEKGHVFDSRKSTFCPYCGVTGLDISGTRRADRNEGEAWAPPPPHQAQIPPPRPQPPARPPDSLAADRGTVGFFEQRLPTQDRPRFDPVTGWLVAIDGPDKGKDFRIRPEQNHIGRDPGMAIAIPSDPRISREGHAVIVYDPLGNAFFLSPGTSRGIVYLNGAPVLGSQPLNAFDTIRIGDTTLVFVPFCGQRFRWHA